MHNTPTIHPTPPVVSEKLRRQIMKTIAKRTFCTIATTSQAQNSHSAGVVYAFAEDALWVHTLSTSRKARNVDSNGGIGVCIPFRRLPVGPPYTIHFQASASIVAMDDPEVLPLIASNQLNSIIGHGALDMADGCFIRIHPHGMIHSFGPGAPVLDLIRDPLTSGARSFRYAQSAA